MLQVHGVLFVAEDGTSETPRLFVVNWVLLKHLLLQSSPVLERDQGVFGWTICDVVG